MYVLSIVVMVPSSQSLERSVMALLDAIQNARLSSATSVMRLMVLVLFSVEMVSLRLSMERNVIMLMLHVWTVRSLKVTTAHVIQLSHALLLVVMDSRQTLKIVTLSLDVQTHVRLSLGSHVTLSLTFVLLSVEMDSLKMERNVMTTEESMDAPILVEQSVDGPVPRLLAVLLLVVMEKW